ncbi:hypothetical protein W02_17650 [Nitrospira sp. KM1]|uniref:DUF58 domain-containing protein n=1 Tax=Nitrospira sp. KM1 TaxID=1936990 RepID=UPI0013A7A8AE|nr:DUF58 domain-containing protein [Nitrospira sp. KM1]BCA54625.1 hypothetical protein W02_17650 [Nitrospira sp. KM1]
MQHRGVYVSPADLMALEFKATGLTLLPRRKSRSVLAGRHASRMRGRGLNFEEIRNYLPGDDIRTIDWKITLRLGKPQVRTYTEERDRPALFVVDQRMPMFFGSRRSLKSVTAAELGALGAWMVLKAGDRVGGVVFNDNEIRPIRPHRSRSRVQVLCQAIATMNQVLRPDSSVRANYEQLDRALETALGIAHHDHLVCIVSDFAGAGERTQQLLRQLRAHNDVIAGLVFDPLVQAAPQSGRLVVTEGNLQVEVNLGDRTVQAPIASFFSGRLRDVTELLQRSTVPLFPITTAEEVVDQVRHLLGRRMRYAG